MIINSELNQIQQPLVLVEIEERSTCLGHTQKYSRYKTYNDASDVGCKWINQNNNNSTMKSCSFGIEKEGHKKYSVYIYHTHIDDIKNCDNYLIATSKKVKVLKAFDFVELVAID